MSFSEKEADTLLLSDEGEPTDDQEQVIASAHEKYAKTAGALMNQANQVLIMQGKGAMGTQSDKVGVQEVRGGLDPTDNRAIHNNNDALIEGVRVPGPSLVPYLLAPPLRTLSGLKTGQNCTSRTRDSCSPSTVCSADHLGSFCRRQG